MPIFRPRKFTFFPFLILFKKIESIDMTPCVISFLVHCCGYTWAIISQVSVYRTIGPTLVIFYKNIPKSKLKILNLYNIHLPLNK